MRKALKTYAPYGFLLLLFATALVFRPILPIDETRYLTVAWEMFLNKQYAVLTLNFEPYHHKPPMLFWLINIFWEIFGVSRGGAMAPIFFASALVIFLTEKLAHRLFKSDQLLTMIPWLILGSLPFLIYSTLIMFDLMVTALLLAALILFLDYGRDPKLYRVFMAGIIMGLGVLTKGPVMYLYVLCPLILYPYWKQEGQCSKNKFYIAIIIAIIVSFVPILLWLVPVILQTKHDFAFWLIWNQTAGRISGNFSAAHVRPFYFYIMLLPILFMPWALLPKFWKNMHLIHSKENLRFLLAATLPTFLIFSLISGKQPHYLLPLIPFILIEIGFLIQDVPIKHIKIISILMFFLCIGGQISASQLLFSKYDLTPYAEIYKRHKDKNWAFIGKYQGELGFIAQIEKPIIEMEISEVSKWFENHPNDLAIIYFNDGAKTSDFREIFTHAYRGKKLGIFTKEDHPHD